MRVALALLLLLTACKPRIEYVPTPCPPPPTIHRPRLPIEDLVATWTPEQRERALWASLAAAVGWGKAQEKLLDAYRVPPQKK